MGLFQDIFREAMNALLKNRTRSLLTMLGIVWGITSVTLLIAYGSSFRQILTTAFDSFGKSAVIAWQGQTSQQAGGQRAGKKVKFEQEDLDYIKATSPAIKTICRENARGLPLQYGDRYTSGTVRSVCAEYGEMRNEVPSVGRWLTAMDVVEHRRVIFLGDELKRKLFGRGNAVGETILVKGMRFEVIGVMDKKIQLSNYFTSDDDSAWVPFTTGSDLYDNKNTPVFVFEPLKPGMEPLAKKQFLAALAERQGFSPTDDKAVTMFGREEFRPVIDGITIGLEGLLLFIGTLTLGIGGVGVMNIMLVSVDERVREIGLRRALGARKIHIQFQLFAETFVIMFLGGAAGILLSWILTHLLGTLPMLGPLFKDESGKADIHMQVSGMTVLLSSAVLFVVGIASGMLPALKASRLDPVEALRYE
ncbi:MAG: ABC transporter permease [Acidobacteriota bacterium]|nr:ABC transporter permease [Acidobacteriota bacterium]